jgi:hypothetical protein
MRKYGYARTLVALLALTGVGGPAVAQNDNAERLNFYIARLKTATIAEMKLNAIRSIKKMGEDGKPGSRALCQAMLDRSAAIETAAADALSAVNKPLYDQVIVLRSEGDAVKHLVALKRIQELGPEGNAATPVLLYHLAYNLKGYQNIDRARRAVNAGGLRRKLHEIDQFFDPDVPLSRYLLTKAVNQVLEKADAETLGKLDDREDLLQLIVHEDLLALTAVAGGETAVVRSVSGMLQNRDVDVRMAVLSAMQRMGTEHAAVAPVVVGAVTPCLGDPEEDVRVGAVEVLRSLGKQAKRALPVLRRVKVRDPSSTVRESAGNAVDALEQQ